MSQSGLTIDPETAARLRRLIAAEGSTARVAGRIMVARHTIERALAGLPLRSTSYTALRLAAERAVKS